MNGDLLAWFADDSEAGATRVGGRPVQAFWMLLRPSFRRVFVEPHRRAGGGVVGWRWSAPAAARKPEPAELADLRLRLKNALTDLAADFERRESSAANGAPPELLTVMRNIVHSLIKASDTKLGEYAVWSDSGWLIRSWGFIQPAPAKLEGAADSPVAVESPLDGSGTSVEAPRPNSRVKLRRIGLWLTALAVLIALIGGWVWLQRGPVQAHDEQPLNVSSAPERKPDGMSVHSNPTSSARRSAPDPSRSEEWVVPHEVSATGSPLRSPTFSPEGERTASSAAVAKRGPNATAGGGLPGALLGVMPTLPDRPEDAAGPKSKVAGRPDPKLSVGVPNGAESAEPELTANKGEKASSNAVVNKPEAKLTSGDVGAKPTGAATPELTIDDRLSAPKPKIPPQPKISLSDVEAKEAPVISDLPPPKTNKPKAPTKPQEDGGGVLEAGVSGWSYRVGPWRLGEEDAFADARSDTLKPQRGLCPESFRAPGVHSGLSFQLAPEARRDRAPTWIDSLTGNPVDRRSSSPNGLRLSWDGISPATGFDARLTADDGRMLARVWLSTTDSRIHVTMSSEIIEVAPWFSVQLTDSETNEGAMVWRSMTPTWSSARWEMQRNNINKVVSVTCRRSTTVKHEELKGVIALVHPTRGWALLWDVEIARISDF